MHTLRTGYHGEILSDSALASADGLPAADPRETAVPDVEDNGTLTALMLRCADLRTDPAGRSWCREDACAVTAEKLLGFLNERAFQFNSRENFSACADWHASVTAVISRRERVKIIIPIFCNVGNPLKRFQVTHLTWSEKVTLHHLHNLASAAEVIYPGGVTFCVVVDANFYSTPFMNSVIETQAYLDEIRHYANKARLTPQLDILDMADILSVRSDAFSDRFHYWLDRCRREEATSLLTWRSSMMSCINLRHIRDYQTLRAVFGGESTPEKEEVYVRAGDALITYRALKNAAADLDWENEISPLSVRATIHTKDIPVLGLRIYPEYKKSSRLLPYHGVAWVHRRRGKYRMTVLTEMEAVSLPDVVRVTGENGITQGYISEDDMS